jgi:hypothetical protein
MAAPVHHDPDGGTVREIAYPSYHARDGWYFTATPDGGVQIENRACGDLIDSITMSRDEWLELCETVWTPPDNPEAATDEEVARDLKAAGIDMRTAYKRLHGIIERQDQLVASFCSLPSKIERDELAAKCDRLAAAMGRAGYDIIALRKLLSEARSVAIEVLGTHHRSHGKCDCSLYCRISAALDVRPEGYPPPATGAFDTPLSALERDAIAAEYEHLRTAVACAANLLNTWCRESGMREASNPYSGLELRDAVDRVWSKASWVAAEQSRRISTLEAELADFLRHARTDCIEGAGDKLAHALWYIANRQRDPEGYLAAVIQNAKDLLETATGKHWEPRP